MSHRRPLIGLALVLLPACTGIGVRPIKRPMLFNQWQLSAPRTASLSPRTLQTLRIYDLDRLYEQNPDETAVRLYAEVVRDPHPDAIFALSEVHYLRGKAIEKKDPVEA